MAIAEILTYCGGIPGVEKTGDMVVSCRPDGIRIDPGTFKKKIEIPFSNIGKISLQTQEQISKDVTLGRLLLVGVFAFGMKKKSRDVSNCLVIEYTDGAISTSAIFSGPNAPKFHASLLKVQQDYYKRNPKREEAPSTSSAADPYSEIEKLHGLLEKGVITQADFDEKKRQLLGL